jgi:hypothetical protein
MVHPRPVRPNPAHPTVNETQTRGQRNDSGQKHCYCENESAGHITGEFEHKGEDVERTEKSSTATAGRHITSKKTGLDVAKERSAHVESNRKASAKLFDSTRLSVVPESKGAKHLKK